MFKKDGRVVEVDATESPEDVYAKAKEEFTKAGIHEEKK